MKRGLISLSAGILALAAAANEGERLAEGANAALSPDGKSLAFQRDAGAETWLGVMDVATREVRWIEKGPGRSAFPSWTKSGDLLYAHGDILHTAYENWKGDFREGYGIRIWKDGAARDLLPRGRWFDYSPAPAADGRTLWFISSREEPKGAHSIHSSICRVDMSCTGKVEVVYTPRPGHPCGVSQAAVSPDGRHVVWGELADVHSVWCLMAARADDFSRVAVLTPPEMAAYSPAFSPDGRHIAFTGCRAGDPGWSIYLLDPVLGAARRLCSGENPSFAPDGGSIVFDRDGAIYRRALAAADFPTAADRWPMAESRRNWTKEREKVIWSMKPPRAGKFPLPKEAVFGLSRTLFARAKVVLPEADKKYHGVVALYFKDAGIWISDNGNAFDLWVDDKGRATLQAGNAIRWGQYAWSQTLLAPGKEHVLTAIRTDGAIWVSIDGERPERMILAAGQSPFDVPLAVGVEHPFPAAGLEIREVEVGAGWPENVPQPNPFGGYGWEDVK